MTFNNARKRAHELVNEIEYSDLPAEQASAVRAQSQLLWQLSQHDAFPALLALIEQHRRSYARARASQHMANHEGGMVHASGSYHALDTLEQALVARLSDEPKARERRKRGEPRGAEIAE